jgi:hypothetical protein
VSGERSNLSKFAFYPSLLDYDVSMQINISDDHNSVSKLKVHKQQTIEQNRSWAISRRQCS